MNSTGRVPDIESSIVHELGTLGSEFQRSDFAELLTLGVGMNSRGRVPKFES